MRMTMASRIEGCFSRRGSREDSLITRFRRRGKGNRSIIWILSIAWYFLICRLKNYICSSIFIVMGIYLLMRKLLLINKMVRISHSILKDHFRLVNKELLLHIFVTVQIHGEYHLLKRKMERLKEEQEELDHHQIQQ